jgi:hypothetical protein
MYQLFVVSRSCSSGSSPLLWDIVFIKYVPASIDHVAFLLATWAHRVLVVWWVMATIVVATLADVWSIVVATMMSAASGWIMPTTMAKATTSVAPPTAAYCVGRQATSFMCFHKCEPCLRHKELGVEFTDGHLVVLAITTKTIGPYSWLRPVRMYSTSSSSSSRGLPRHLVSKRPHLVHVFCNCHGSLLGGCKLKVGVDDTCSCLGREHTLNLPSMRQLPSLWWKHEEEL